MKMKLIALFSLFISFFTFGTEPDKYITWDLTDDQMAIQVVNNIRAQFESPDKFTLVSFAADIKIEKSKVKTHVRKVYYFANARDIQDYGAVSLYFSQYSETLKITSAFTINPGGTVRPYDKKTAKLLDTDSSNSFSDTKELVLSVPNLIPGSFFILEYVKELDKRKLQREWSQILYAQFSYPIADLNISVIWSEDEPIFWSLKNASMRCLEELSSLRCSKKNVAPMISDKAIYWRDHLQQLVLGEYYSWDQVSDSVLQLLRKAKDDTQGVEELLGELVDEGMSVEQKVSRIHEFVSRGIRYVSFSEREHTVVPHTVASVLKNRYGDCKDKSMLLHELLQRIGLEPYPVLVATNRSKPSALGTPSSNYFNHVIICFEYRGNRYCLDSTDQDTFWKAHSPWVQNNVSLPLKTKTNVSVVSPSKYRWKINIETGLIFTEEGGQLEYQTRSYLDEYAASMSNFLLNKEEQDRTHWLNEQYRDVVYSEGQPVIRVEQIEDMSPELKIVSETEILGIADVNANLNYTESDAWLVNELSDLKLKNRNYPEHFPGLKITSKFSYDLKSIWKTYYMTPEVGFNHEYGMMHRSVQRINDSEMVVTTQVMIPARDVDSEKIDYFNEMLDVFIRHSKIHFMARK